MCSSGWLFIRALVIFAGMEVAENSWHRIPLSSRTSYICMYSFILVANINCVMYGVQKASFVYLSITVNTGVPRNFNGGIHKADPGIFQKGAELGSLGCGSPAVGSRGSYVSRVPYSGVFRISQRGANVPLLPLSVSFCSLLLSSYFPYN